MKLLTVSFEQITKNKNKSDLCTITMRIYYDRKNVYQDTGKRVLQNQFDQKESKKGNWRVVKKHPDQDRLNSHLKVLYDRVFDIENDFILASQPFSAASIKEKLKTAGKTATEAFLYILEENRRLAIETKKAMRSTITRLHEFAPHLLIKEIDYEFVKNFEKFLLERKSRTGGTLAVNTINKYIKDLSLLLTASIKYKYIKENPIVGYDFIPQRADKESLRLGKNVNYEEIEPLSPSDVSRLETFNFEKIYSPSKAKSLSDTRDMFLFSCFSGLRLGDLLKITPSHCKDGILTFSPEKGKRNRKKTLILRVNIGKLFNGKGLKIFQKHSRLKIGTTVFGGSGRSRSTHQGNVRLIAGLLFPGRKISIHSARHTLATLLDGLGMSSRDIQIIMGHSTDKTTKEVYIDTDWDNVNNAIDQVFKKAE